MQIQKNRNKLNLVFCLLIFLLGCTNNQLTKSKSLIESETFYAKTSNKILIGDRANAELTKAKAALESARQAESETERNAFVYVANNHIKAALKFSESAEIKKKIDGLDQMRLEIRANYNKKRKALKKKKNK